MRIRKVEVRAYTRVWFMKITRFTAEAREKINDTIKQLEKAAGSNGMMGSNFFVFIDEDKLSQQQKPLKDFLKMKLWGLELGKEAVYLDWVWIVTITLSARPSSDPTSHIREVPGSDIVDDVLFRGKTALLYTSSKPSREFIEAVKNVLLR